MLSDVLKSESFSIAFSFLIGVGIWAILRPVCKGNDCSTIKAPPLKDFDGKTFRLNGACYKFTAKTKECPVEGYIEPFYINQLENSRDHFEKIQINGVSYSLGTFAERA
ncbi:MAG: hypothetical protein EBT86_01200 [Actinobacteria bacterium]|nr:hypothetical protein [Actinomycetota bacterium]NDG27315.1 hypothetical protein [Pseudomonadota bacterium]